MEGEAFEDLLELARRGDEWAISCLFRALQPSLLRYLSRRAPAAAEDLAAEVWLALARGLATFSGPAHELRALLFTIARRRVADYYRARARRPNLVHLDGDTCDPATTEDVAELAIGALSAEQAIDALVSQLPSDQAEVVLLRVVADLSVDAVARVMGRRPGAVRVLQHRALRTLARRFDSAATPTEVL